MLTVLVRARLRMIVNTVRASTARYRAIFAVLTLLGGGFFAVVALLSAALVHLAQGTAPITDGLSAPAALLVGKTYEYLVLFLLAGSVPFVASSLFQGDDLPLLLTTPVPLRAVVAAKMLDAIAVNASQALSLGFPVLLGLGLGAGLSLSGWGWMLVSTVLLLVVPAAATTAVLLLAAALLGMRRVRLAVTAVSIGLGLAITIVAVLGASHAAQSGGLDLKTLRAALSSPSDANQSPAPVSLIQTKTVNTSKGTGREPGSWAAAMLRDTAGGHSLGPAGARGLLLLLASAAVLLGLCLPLGARVLSSDAFLESTGSGTQFPTAGQRWLPRFLPSVVRGFLIKDYTYLRRDLILQGQIGTAMLLFLVPFLLRMAQGTVSPADNELYGWLALGLLILIAYMVTSIAALSSVGLEGQAAWLALAAPISRAAMLKAKRLGTFTLSLVIVTLGLIIDWPMFNLPALFVLRTWLALCAVCYALSGLGVGLSGLFPRFVYENPAHRASVWALLLGFTLSSAYLLLCTAIGTAAVLLSPTFGREWAWGIGIVLFAALSLVTGTIPVLLASRRLESYEWEM